MTPFRLAHSRSALFRCLLLLIFWTSPRAHGSILYSQFPGASGLLSPRLALISSDGSADVPLSLPLLNLAYAAVSRNGARLAVAAGDPARPFKLSTDIYLVRPATGEINKLSAFEDSASASGFITYYPSYLALSPDGQKVAAGMVTYLGARGTTVYTNLYGDPFGPYDTTSKITHCVSLMVFNANGTAPYLVTTALCDDDFAHPGEGVDWSPTQDIIAYPFNTPVAFGGAGGVFNITAIYLTETTPNAADLGRRRKLTFPTGIVGFPFEAVSVAWSDDFAPAFSPDGRQVAYVRSLTVLPNGGTAPLAGVPSIRVIDTDGSGDHEVIAFQRGSYITRLSWSPDGNELAFDLGAQALRSGFPLRSWDPDTVTLAKVKTDGTGFASVRGPRAAWPVWLPSPQLAATVARGTPASISLSWTDLTGAQRLESSPTLGSQEQWIAVSIKPTADGTTLRVTVPATEQRAYFRLRQP